MNIRTLAGVCAGLALVSGMVTANLWRELRAEQELTAGLKEQLAAAAAARPAPTTGVDAGPAPTATQVVSNVQPEKPAPTPTPPPRTNVFGFAANAGISEQELMKDPDYRKAMVMLRRQSIEMGYTGLAEELGLSKEEVDRFLDMMVEHQMASSNLNQVATPNSQPDRAAMEQLMRERQALQRQQDQEIRSTLGEAKYARWQEYQPTRSARMQASNYSNQLGQAGYPLDSAQLKSLTAVVIAEQKSMQQDIRTLSSARSAGDVQSMQEQFQNRQTESNRRIVEAAAPHLSAQQLGALRSQFEQQDAINRASNRAREAMAVRPPQP